LLISEAVCAQKLGFCFGFQPKQAADGGRGGGRRLQAPQGRTRNSRSGSRHGSSMLTLKLGFLFFVFVFVFFSIFLVVWLLKKLWQSK
jgi:hypothetical protein